MSWWFRLLHRLGFKGYAHGGYVGSVPKDGMHLSIIHGCVCGRGYVDGQ